MPAKYNQNDQPSCLNKAEVTYDGREEVSAESTLLFYLFSYHVWCLNTG